MFGASRRRACSVDPARRCSRAPPGRGTRGTAPKITPQMFPIPPRITMQRMNTEMLKKKSPGNVAALEDRVVGAGDAAEERAGRVRPRLRPHQRHAHRGGGGLVLADRDPGAAEPRVAQPQRAEDREQRAAGSPSRRRRRSTGSGGRAACLQHEVVRRQEAACRSSRCAEAGRVDRRDPVRAVREVEARAEEVVAVPRDLRQDLAEAERHDREVVAAQAQRRQADQDPDERGRRCPRSAARARSRSGCRAASGDRARPRRCGAFVLRELQPTRTRRPCRRPSRRTRRSRGRAGPRSRRRCSGRRPSS